ncbi:MAG: cyclomaltodextrinase N-terminal domain-containing protein, partial [Ferruginibacter sp.]
MKKSITIFPVFLFYLFGFSQPTYQCYPTNWWTGMKWNKVQIMIHGDSIANAKGGFTITYPGVKLDKINKVENANYVFLDISIAAIAKPGIVKIKVNRESNPFTIDFDLKAKRPGRGVNFAQGVTSADFMYLILPDRFSNGDPSNDKVAGMRDQSLNRDT